MKIIKPPNSGRLYHNYKKYHSIVLQALVGADYKFLAIVCGGYGSQSDGGTFFSSSLKKAIDNKIIELPEKRFTPSSKIMSLFFMVADHAYSLSKNIMTPY